MLVLSNYVLPHTNKSPSSVIAIDVFIDADIALYATLYYSPSSAIL